jgi:hypothetical protein
MCNRLSVSPRFSVSPFFALSAFTMASRGRRPDGRFAAAHMSTHRIADFRRRSPSQKESRGHLSVVSPERLPMRRRRSRAVGDKIITAAVGVTTMRVLNFS